MNLNECFDRRLLRRDRPDAEKAKRSIEISKTKLKQAHKAFQNELYDASLVLAYTSMFHAARAVLFRDGIIEKSHVCMIEYLRTEYVRKGRLGEGFVNSLDQMRIDRHEAIYGLEASVTMSQTDHAIQQCKEFIETITKLLKM